MKWPVARAVALVTAFATVVVLVTLAPAASGSEAHKSPCHALHSCPSDDHTYVWFDGAGQGWDCGKLPNIDYGTARGSTAILYESLSPVYVGEYECSLTDPGLAPPLAPLQLRQGPWTRYVPLITAQAMASEVDRSAMPIDGLSAVYLPGWLPPNYALIGWMRWVDASGQSVPDVSLVLYLTHRIKGREISPSWSVERLDPELGGCAANYSYIPRQLRVAGRVIRYGNVAFRHKRSEGAVAVCFRGGIAATFHVDVPLPLRVLKRIGIRAMRASG